MMLSYFVGGMRSSLGEWAKLSEASFRSGLGFRTQLVLSSTAWGYQTQETAGADTVGSADKAIGQPVTNSPREKYTNPHAQSATLSCRGYHRQRSSSDFRTWARMSSTRSKAHHHQPPPCLPLASRSTI